jgi:hypothetical protein
VRGGSGRAWQWWLAALVGAALAVSGAGGVAVAAEQIAADAPVPSDPRAFGSYYVMSPYVQSGLGMERQVPGQTTLSNVVPTAGGRVTRVDVFFANYSAGRNADPVTQNFFVDVTRVDAEGRPTEVLARASVPVGSLPQPSGQGTVAVRMWVETATPSPPPPTGPSSPPPAPQRASDAPPLCGRPVVLTDVTLRGRRVRLAGMARPQFGVGRLRSPPPAASSRSRRSPSTARFARRPSAPGARRGCVTRLASRTSAPRRCARPAC